ncbi:DAGLA [Cordylochernes scorpioides]|uniref:DAGLA n=1 Tax=Cordylochernes scorpioides TaxID=51811 RepID=A0ABY6KJS9_9ARAC|nr:DAGLA [Cordylochernes scorpioides]
MTTPFTRVTTRSVRRALERPRLAALPIHRSLEIWVSIIDAPPVHPALPAVPLTAPLVTNTGECQNIRPLVREAFNIIGRPPDLQAWIFVEDDELAILSSAKARIYRYFVQVLKEDKKQESSKMETNEIRAVIKYLWRISTEDEHRPGRPVESVTQENIEKIHDLVMLDRRMTVRQIEETLGIPKTTVFRIMREHLGLRKLSARWVPKLLTPDQKAVRRKLSSDNFALFEANPEEFV